MLSAVRKLGVLWQMGLLCCGSALCADVLYVIYCTYGQPLAIAGMLWNGHVYVRWGANNVRGAAYY